MPGKPGGRRLLVSLRSENTVGAKVAGYGLEQIVGPVVGDLLIRLLRIKAGTAQIFIGEFGRHFVRLDGEDRRQAHEDFPAVMMRRPDDSFSRHFGLKNRRNRLRLAWHL